MLYLWRSDICLKEFFDYSNYKKGISLVFRLWGKGPGKKVGTTRVLHYVFIQIQCEGEWKRTLNAVWSAHGLKSAYQSQYWLLFLYGAPYSKWYVHEEKINTRVSKYTISNSLVPHGDGLPVSEPPDNFAVYSDDEDNVSSNSQGQQPSAARYAEYLPSTDSSSLKITEEELSDLIRDLELPKNKAELLASWLQQ